MKGCENMEKEQKDLYIFAAVIGLVLGVTFGVNQILAERRFAKKKEKMFKKMKEDIFHKNES